MADTLTREAIAYGSQPLSPVPQYWDGSASYEKVQGNDGAIFVELITSSGATARFSGANPGSVQLTATSTVTISGSATAVISGTATVNFSGSGTVAVSGSVTVSGTVTVTGSLTADIAVMPVAGTQANAWSAAATVSAGATSNSIDLRYNYRIGYFGEITNTASATLALEVSQDNTNFYQAATNVITAGTTSPFHYSTETAARYARLAVSGVSATVTATIAGK